MDKEVCGVPFSDLPREALVARAFARWKTQGVCTVFTPNATMLAGATADPALRDLLQRADLSVTDGQGVLLAARLTGVPLTAGKTAGVELGLALVAEAARRGLGVALYGGRPGVAEEAARRLRERFPNLSVVLTRHGYGNGEEDATAITASRAALILVGLGFPRQERWIAAHGRACGGILLGLGGGLDLYAGRVKRAPRLWRRLGLEWLYRMLREPRRLKALPSLLLWFLSLVFPGQRKNAAQ